MQFTKLGATGLDVSRICVGCMSFGEPDRGSHNWSLPETESRAIIKQALDAGINFFDTANVYSDGSSEEITGRALKDMAQRDDVVIATKVYSRMRPGANGMGLSRKVIMSEIDHSLRRLGTDYIDLYQIHRFDETTPIEETMAALHDVVRAGKARYVGASSMSAWQFGKALFTARARGWTEFVSMQPQLNLLYREEEREMLPLCAEQKIGVIPWSPLARGRLTRDAGDATKRKGNDAFADKMYGPHEREDQAIVDALGAIATARGRNKAQVALAWVLQHPTVTAPIVGATKPQHLADAIAALDLTLTPDEVKQLEAPYTPRAVTGIVVPRS